jgi:O-antigen/teichoic acid export membrane protein
VSLSSKQLIKNTAWTFLELALYPLLMIVATPVFISRLGIEQYGLWMLINTITLGMNVLNLGIGDTNIRLIARHRVTGDLASIRRIFNFNFSLSLFLCGICILLGFLFWEFHFISLFDSTAGIEFAGKILLLACISTGLKFVEVAIVSVFKAFERFDVNSKLMLVSKNSVMVVCLLLVLAGFGLVTVFIATVSLNLLNLFLQMWTLHRFRPGIFTVPSFNFLSTRLDVLNYNLWYWLQSVIALAGFLADKLLIAVVADIKVLGYYSIATLIGSQIHNFFLAFGSFVFPRVSFKLSSKSEIIPLYFVSRSFVVLPGWLIIGVLVLFGDAVFKLWLGAEVFAHSIFFIKAYLVFEAGMLLIIVPFYFINGTALVRLNSVFESIIRSSHFIAMLAGYYLAGVNGILYGLIFSTFLNIPFQYYFFHKKVLQKGFGLQFVWVLLPVCFLYGLMSSVNVYFQLSLVFCFLLSCKLIYFDRAKQYSEGFLRSSLPW